MIATNEGTSRAGWRKVGALILAVAVIGLPINNINDYALLLILTVVIFCGDVRAEPRAWMAAMTVVAVAAAAQVFLAPPRIEEGHNVFLPSAALERSLPGDVYHHMVAEFDAQYPPAQRCGPAVIGCWQQAELPDRPFAFSADGVLRAPAYSRSVTSLDFSDPVWLRLGFTNELRYNWYTRYPDVGRATRDRRFWMGWRRWHLDMPWFEMIRLPAAYAGGELCWRGTVMWEGENEHFTPFTGDGCRIIQATDTGRRIFGVAIKPGSFAMHLSPPWRVQTLNFVRGILLLAAAGGLVAVLVRVVARRMLFPIIVIALSALVIAVDDTSFLGGVRPFDGGDDGLYYDGVGRAILQKLMASDIAGFLEGGEKVFYYGGPGLRYFRAIEHIFFGESYLGYLSLLLLLPFLVFYLFRRFLPETWSLALIFLFVAIPVGILFGTSFVQYEQWASRGFADPAAYILFIAGVLLIVDGKSPEIFMPAFFGALLLALGIFMKPIVAPAAAIFLGGAGIAALYLRQWPRLAGLCVGFLPVFFMALHNWVYGHVFVLFSANAEHAAVLVMPPSAYAAAMKELLRFDFGGEHINRGAVNIVRWLAGPSGVPWRLYAPLVVALVPLHAASLAVLVYVTFWGRAFDSWLRLIGAAALAQHAVALFYDAGIPRYHFLTWFLTMLVVMVWVQRVGVDWFKRRYPDLSERFALHPWSQWLASGLARLQKASA